LLFVWHTGEEKGLWGSEYFTDHPTVARDSIITQLNIDMIGRGDVDDLKNGGPGALGLLGSRRLSTQLGDLVEEVNLKGKHGFTFDYQFDANGHPQQYYCRSDHYEYARYGIPIVFFSTGDHRDYHMATDEPQYIDYDKYARVTELIMDLGRTLANLEQRVVVDKPKPDPNGRCVQ
jgi:Zn-dependent M28 family amino/carboxypeptidase